MTRSRVGALLQNLCLFLLFAQVILAYSTGDGMTFRLAAIWIIGYYVGTAIHPTRLSVTVASLLTITLLILARLGRFIGGSF